MTIHVYIHQEPDGGDIASKLDSILHQLRALSAQEKNIMAQIQDLVDEVAAETTVKDSVLALIDRLVANQNDPAALDALLNQMKSNKDAIAKAVTDNTPAAPPTP